MSILLKKGQARKRERQRESDVIVHWLRESVNGNEICHSILVERKRKRESEKVDPVMTLTVG